MTPNNVPNVSANGSFGSTCWVKAIIDPPVNMIKVAIADSMNHPSMIHS